MWLSPAPPVFVGPGSVAPAPSCLSGHPHFPSCLGSPCDPLGFCHEATCTPLVSGDHRRLTQLLRPQVRSPQQAWADSQVLGGALASKRLQARAACRVSQGQGLLALCRVPLSLCLRPPASLVSGAPSLSFPLCETPVFSHFAFVSGAVPSTSTPAPRLCCGPRARTLLGTKPAWPSLLVEPSSQGMAETLNPGSPPTTVGFYFKCMEQCR